MNGAANKDFNKDFNKNFNENTIIPQCTNETHSSVSLESGPLCSSTSKEMVPTMTGAARVPLLCL